MFNKNVTRIKLDYIKDKKIKCYKAITGINISDIEVEENTLIEKIKEIYEIKTQNDEKREEISKKICEYMDLKDKKSANFPMNLIEARTREYEKNNLVEKILDIILKFSKDDLISKKEDYKLKLQTQIKSLFRENNQLFEDKILHEKYLVCRDYEKTKELVIETYNLREFYDKLHTNIIPKNSFSNFIDKIINIMKSSKSQEEIFLETQLEVHILVTSPDDYLGLTFINYDYEETEEQCKKNLDNENLKMEKNTTIFNLAIYIAAMSIDLPIFIDFCSANTLEALEVFIIILNIFVILTLGLFIYVNVDRIFKGINVPSSSLSNNEVQNETATSTITTPTVDL